MPNPFSKGWKYLTASLDNKIEENADPVIQIKQAAEAAKKQHADIEQQAASVIGNRNQLQMKLNRLLKDQQSIQEKARQALSLSDSATDPAEQHKYLNAAEVYASQLVGVESEIEQTTTLHQQAEQAAEQATQQVKQSEARLHEQLAQINELTTQAQQTKMQEAAVAASDQINSIDPDRDVPTMDSIREKIERRYADALGSQELMQSSMNERIHEIEATTSERDMRANAKLDAIRAQMRGELPAGSEETEPPADK
ncbi:PspA/IM30 family protein [Corynebacterium diphtheriae]|nr:PspA/IM30 family protein [Corynebacterium diphtheriae]CAB1024917.1 PspA/IM30 family protein [Corynebacterium diphtheriae]